MVKGGNAEEALAQYFRNAGFFALRGVPFRHNNENITDIDVWLYERGGGLERRLFIVDAKYKARPKIAERLLWTAGLRDALDVDGGFVAATGVREANRRLARRIGITIIDFQVLGGGSIETLKTNDRLSKEEIGVLLVNADRQRESKVWRSHFNDTVAALGTAFGGSSSNIALRAAHFYAEQAIIASPNSPTAQIALRMLFLCASIAAESLDYVAAQGAFQAIEKRRSDIEDVIRYGADHQETKRQLDLALRLTREYLPNGTVLANKLRDRFDSDARSIPADILAEVVTKMMSKGGLFEAGRILENSAHLRTLPSFANLPAEAKAFTGALLDFHGIDRERVAKAWDTPSDKTAISSGEVPSGGESS